MGAVANADELAVELAVELGCKVVSLLTAYLGLSLGAAHKTTTVWHGMEERMRKKACFLEKELYLQRKKSNSYQKYCSQHAYLPNVSLKNA